MTGADRLAGSHNAGSAAMTTASPFASRGGKDAGSGSSSGKAGMFEGILSDLSRAEAPLAASGATQEAIPHRNSAGIGFPVTLGRDPVPAGAEAEPNPPPRARDAPSADLDGLRSSETNSMCHAGDGERPSEEGLEAPQRAGSFTECGLSGTRGSRKSGRADAAEARIPPTWLPNVAGEGPSAAWIEPVPPGPTLDPPAGPSPAMQVPWWVQPAVRREAGDEADPQLSGAELDHFSSAWQYDEAPRIASTEARTGRARAEPAPGMPPPLLDPARHSPAGTRSDLTELRPDGREAMVPPGTFIREKIKVLAAETHFPPLPSTSATDQILQRVVAELSAPTETPVGAGAPPRPLTRTAEAAATAAGMASTCIKTLTIQLEPASLGPVTVTLRLARTSLTLEIDADDVETARVIDLGRGQLASKLRDSGYMIDELVIADGRSSRRFPRSQRST